MQDVLDPGWKTEAILQGTFGPITSVFCFTLRSLIADPTLVRPNPIDSVIFKLPELERLFEPQGEKGDGNGGMNYL